MTQQEAKDLTIEVWSYLAEHPEISDKGELPDTMVNKLLELLDACPLCELFRPLVCRGCPLKDAGDSCHMVGSSWYDWVRSSPMEFKRRSAAAWRIVEITRAWELGGEIDARDNDTV
jgi:hypothetical protein